VTERMTNIIRNWQSDSLDQLSTIAQNLQHHLSLPAVIIMDGEMGAGKTTFVSYFQRSCFPNDQRVVSSPTYSLINDLGEILHADLYRIEEQTEIMRLELPLYIDGKSYLFFEWGINYLDELQRELGAGFSYYHLKIEILKDESRYWTLEKL
jgi:tRNA threonylcarbamoyladenosine biosynthesis protein TsaE